MAWMRCQAVMISSAHGQVAAIFRVLRRPPRTSRAPACRTRTQRLRLCPGEFAVQGQELQPGQQDAGDHGGVEPRLVQPVVMRWEMSQVGVLPGADDVLDAGVDAVRGVDVGALAPPAPGRGGQVRHPRGVTPAVGGLEQGQLRARGAAARGGRRPASSPASPSADRRPGPRAAARSAPRRALPRSSTRGGRIAGSRRHHRRGARGPRPCRRSRPPRRSREPCRSRPSPGRPAPSRQSR